MKIFALLCRYARASFVLAVLVGSIGGLAVAALLALVNRVLGSGDLVVAPWVPWSFAALCLLSPLARVGAGFLLYSMSQQAVLDLRLELCGKILAAPLLRLEELGAHRLTAALTEDVGSVAGALTLLPQFCMQATVILGTLAYLGWLSPRMLLLLLAFLALGVPSYLLMARWSSVRQGLAREQGDALFEHFRAVIEGTKELKLHRPRRLAFVERLRVTAAAYRQLNVAARSIFIAAAGTGHLLFFIAVGVVLLGPRQLLSPDRGIITGFALGLLYIMNPLQDVLNMLPVVSQARVALAKVERLGLSLTTAREEQREWQAAAGDARWREIELRAVTHSYTSESRERSFTLGPIDLKIRRGELLFVVGGNGSGKTTLAKLVTGLYHPHSGAILIDGLAVGEDERESYRQSFSAVFGDFYLFRDLLGLDHADLDARARGYLEQLELGDKVKADGGRLSTTALSQGQRKRLALLTAYLEDRSFYLFDEWAADQDPLYKEVFYRQILPALKSRGKTVLVVCHDERYFGLADRILKLESGRLVADPSSESAPPHRRQEAFPLLGTRHGGDR